MSEDRVSVANPRPANRADDNPLEVTVLMPCLNEVATLAVCIEEARQAIQASGVRGEVLIADNGSTDGSQAAAERAGARVIAVSQRGYGSALAAGIAAARGRYVLMGDADQSYDFRHLDRFLARLREGNDLVMGNRFAGGIQPGAMPWKNRMFGNPALSFIGRLFFGSRIGDFHCGLRAFSAEAIRRLDLRTTGMEFASEMVIKAQLHGLRIAEVPTVLRPDGRGRRPHLRPWRDGWRHLRFMLLFSPRWLFLYPGLALFTVGLAVGARLVAGPWHITEHVTLDVNTLLFSGVAILVGFQSVSFAVLTKMYAVKHGLRPVERIFQSRLERMTLEAGVMGGLLLAAAGFALSAWALWFWRSRGFGDLQPTQVLRWVIPGGTLLTLGCQLILNSFFFGVLGLDTTARAEASR
jgi:glycosyltransferase involved in cell wall biosynthesis